MAADHHSWASSLLRFAFDLDRALAVNIASTMALRNRPAGAASGVHRLSRGTADLMDAVLDSVEYGPILVPAAIRPAPRPTLGQRDPPA